MSTVTIPRPDVSTEDVAAALRKDLGPHYQVQPGMRTSLLPGAPDPGWPDSIVVGTGAGRVFRVQLDVDHRGGGTRIRVQPAGVTLIRLVNTFASRRRSARYCEPRSASSRGPPRPRSSPLGRGAFTSISSRSTDRGRSA